MRTLSKLGLAGLRLGLLVGPEQWLQEFDKLRLPYNVNVLTQLVAEHVLAHAGRAGGAGGRDSRRACAAASSAGCIAWCARLPQRSNFILFRAANADGVFAALKQRGVLIKNVSGSHPMLVDCLRVTVGTPQENDRFLEAVSESLRRAA